MEDPKSKNYTPTADPNVVIGKHGVRISKQDFENANKNGYAWKDFPAYADYVGGWAQPITNPVPVHPYYRTYGGTPNIPGGDVQLLSMKYPQVNDILKRNIAPDGQVPMFGPSDADLIRSLIAKEKLAAQGSHYPDSGMYDAMTAALKKQ